MADVGSCVAVGVFFTNDRLFSPHVEKLWHLSDSICCIVAHTEGWAKPTWPWQCVSMNPGDMTSPEQSTISFASSGTSETTAMVPPMIPIDPWQRVFHGMNCQLFSLIWVYIFCDTEYVWVFCFVTYVLERPRPKESVSSSCASINKSETKLNSVSVQIPSVKIEI